MIAYTPTRRKRRGTLDEEPELDPRGVPHALPPRRRVIFGAAWDLAVIAAAVEDREKTAHPDQKRRPASSPNDPEVDSQALP